MNNYIDLFKYNKTLIKDIKSNYIVLLFILLFTIVLIYILMFINIDNYYINNCIVKEDLLVCSVEYNDLKYLINNNYMYIDKKRYNYKIYSINEEMIKTNGSYYKEVNLNLNLDNKNIDNNILKIKVRIYHKSIFNYIKDVIINGKDK